MVINLIGCMRRFSWWGSDAEANPWGAATLEWRIPSPPPAHQFDSDPMVTDGPYDYDIPHLGDDEAAGSDKNEKTEVQA